MRKLLGTADNIKSILQGYKYPVAGLLLDILKARARSEQCASSLHSPSLSWLRLPVLWLLL